MDATDKAGASGHPARFWVLVGCCICWITVGAGSSGVAAAHGQGSRTVAQRIGSVAAGEPWDLPVDAEVVDYFRAPRTEWGPGNRGWEFASHPGDPVVAVGTGRVSFAGWVAGRGVVSIDHGDGLVSSVTGLSEVWVAGSELLGRGRPIGLAQSHLHLGFRMHGSYVDPSLFYSPPTHAILVPIPSEP